MSNVENFACLIYEKMSRINVLIFGLLIAYTEGQDVFRFANHYADHMVLQRDPGAAVFWGFGEIHAPVSVRISDKVYYTTVKRDSRGLVTWAVSIDPFPPGGPYDIEALSLVQNVLVAVYLRDVYFGDVWICGGQSNMEFPVTNSYTAKEEIDLAPTYHKIRLFTVSRFASEKPVLELNSGQIGLQWSVPSKTSVPEFSAVCWMFGRRLYDLYGIPLGLINTNYPGSCVEAWSSPETNSLCNGSLSIDSKTDIFQNVNPNANSALWNAMIYPILNMTIYGVIWYQGEQNAVYRTDFYNCTFPAMIDGWRKEWHQSSLGKTDTNFPFGFVQLSAVCNDTLPKTPEIRWKQTAEFGFVPNEQQSNVFMAVAMDLPDGALDSYHCVHSRHKADVADRLVLGARAKAYHEDVYWTGPILDEAIHINETIKVTFKSTTVGGEGLDVRNVSGFEIRPENGNWSAVNIVQYNSNEIYLNIGNLSAVSQIRYAWKDEPCIFKQCAIYDKLTGLPCGPFLADVWEI